MASSRRASSLPSRLDALRGEIDHTARKSDARAISVALHDVESGDELHYEGLHFTAIGQTLFPRQIQEPHPPLWLGGNARIVRDRIARWGDGWAPMLGGGEVTRTRSDVPCSFQTPSLLVPLTFKT